MFVAANGPTWVLKPSAKEEVLRFFGKKESQETSKTFVWGNRPSKVTLQAH
jgi:hypothetical protein